MTRIALGLLIVDLILVGAYGIHRFTGWGGAWVTTLLDLDGEESVAAWFSSMKLSWIALLIAGCWLAVRRQTPRRVRWSVLGLAGLFAFLSMDEAVQIHEKIGEWSDALLPSGDRDATVFRRTGVWMVLLGPPLVAALLVMLFYARRVWSRAPYATHRLMAGVGIFLAGALGVEMVSNLTRAYTWRTVQVIVEEGAEMLGVTLMIWAVLDVTRCVVLNRAPQLERLAAAASVPPPTDAARVPELRAGTAVSAG